ncbi:MAG TPA: hypothetical protein PKD09_06640 [Aggregatilinea sp.]|uniref:hypothetical protein n=1 Tax=Aggregatilinea sp. TaxID=2806333 RepID=UPI002D10B614|nr:hypothetical protein [Aggregatilinea sp.]HML21304.1 hypothetical protein [Aggregatilinea sp.]
MFVYGVIALLVGAALLTGVFGLAVRLHRRHALPYALLSVGILTGMGALIVQTVLIRGLDRGLMGVLSIGALAIGLSVGVTHEIARLFGYQYLARSTVTKPQAMMIGLGHGLVQPVYNGLVAIGMGLSMIGGGGDRPDDPASLLSGAGADALNSFLPIFMHMALGWIVLQVFLRGEIGWLFAAIFLHSVVEMMAALIGTDASWLLAAWWLLVALTSAIILARLRPPAPG